jgi:hypothetical protein
MKSSPDILGDSGPKPPTNPEVELRQGMPRLSGKPEPSSSDGSISNDTTPALQIQLT